MSPRDNQEIRGLEHLFVLLSPFGAHTPSGSGEELGCTPDPLLSVPLQHHGQRGEGRKGEPMGEGVEKEKDKEFKTSVSA